MHGQEIVVYLPNNKSAATRIVVDDNVKEGHALAAAILREPVMISW